MGRRATGYFATIVGPGDQVRIELDLGERDRYGRLLGYIWLANGKMLNEEMVKGGYASLMTYPPNVKYSGRFEKLIGRPGKPREGYGVHDSF